MALLEYIECIEYNPSEKSSSYKNTVADPTNVLQIYNQFMIKHEKFRGY